MCSSQGKDLVLAPSLLPDFFPLALAVILKRGHRDRPHLLRCARGAAPGQDARARVSPSLPPLVTRMRRGNHHPFPPSLPPSPPSLLSPHFRNGWVLQCGCALSWLASAASQGGGFPLAWPPATVGAKAPLGGSAQLSGEYWTSTGAQRDESYKETTEDRILHNGFLLLGKSI